jgi:hypothetical protein
MHQPYSYSSDFADIYIEEGIVRVIFYGRITPDKALIIVNERLKVTNGRAYPTLADYRYGNALEKKSRAIFASPDAMKNVVAGACIFSNSIQRMFINAYLWFDKPPIPTAVFNSEEKALDWLQLYKTSLN